jgi:hypothetical protein
VTVTLSTGATQSLWAWKNGSASSVPAWWTAASNAAGTLKAWAVFDGTLTTAGAAVGNSDQDVKLLASQNITKVTRIRGTTGSPGEYDVYISSGVMSDANYLILGTASRASFNATVMTVNTSFTPTTTQFRISHCNSENSNRLDAVRGSIAVFA